MVFEKLFNNYRNKKSLALLTAFVVMISMLTMGAIYDIEAKDIVFVQKDCFNDYQTKREIVTRQSTVEEFLNEQQIAVENDDVLNADFSDELYDKQVIILEKSRNIQINADGKTVFSKAVTKTVEEALNDAGIIINEQDIVNPGITEAIENDMIITVQRVITEDVSVETDIPYETQTVADSSRYIGDNTIKQQGVNGKRADIYRITTVDGIQTSKELIETKILQEAVNEIVVTGTKQNQSFSNKKQTLAKSKREFRNSGDEVVAAASNSGREFSYSKVLTVTATAYDPSLGTNAGYSKTAYGLVPQYGVVAVDPSIIPLGTRLYIESADGGASWVYGYCIAGDTGGAIKGNKVDLCYNTKAECIQFGRRSATVYVLD